MPRRFRKINKKRKPLRKRFIRRRRKFAKTTYKGRVVKVHSAMPLPPKFTCKHRYVEDTTIQLDPTGVAPVIYSFRANSLYDPNYSGVGHQPLGFDQIMPFYNHYTVIGAKIKVQFFNCDTSLLVPQIAGIYMNGEQTPTLANWQTLAEQGNLTYGSMAMNNANTTLTSLALTKTFSARKYFGRRGILTEDDFRGTSTTNPAEQAYFHIFVCPSDNATNTGVVRALVEIEYISVYTELKQLSSS